VGHAYGTSSGQRCSGQLLDAEGRHRPVDAVGSDHGVEVDDATPLVLGHPAERKLHERLGLGLSPPERAGEVTHEIDGGAAPELRRACVVKDGAFVVVAVDAKGCAQHVVVVGMVAKARQRLAVLAAGGGGGGATRSTCLGGVDKSETRSSQRQQDGGARSDGLVNALAADESGSYEVSSVTSVDGGARRASSLATCAACLEEHAVGKAPGREGQPSAVPIVGHHDASQAHRVAAPAAAPPLRSEFVKLLLLQSPPDGSHHQRVGFVDHGRMHDRAPWTPFPPLSSFIAGQMGKQRAPTGHQRTTMRINVH
jgi:hypothetical protein